MRQTNETTTTTSEQQQQQQQGPNAMTVPLQTTVTTTTTTRGAFPAADVGRSHLPSLPSNTTTATRLQLLRLLICAVGICVCYLYYGVLQEQLLSSSSPTNSHHHPELGPTFILFTQCVTNVILATIWQALDNEYNNNKGNEKKMTDVDATTTMSSSSSSLSHGLLLLTAGCYVFAMVCSNEAIRYVSYPVQVLAKSCKLVSTMLVGQVVERQSRRKLYSTTDWMASLCISFGIVLFQFARYQQQKQELDTGVEISEDNDYDRNTTTTDDDDNNPPLQQYYGMALLLGSLTMDGILSACQNLLKHHSPNKKPPNAVETMLYVNLYALLFLYPLCQFTGQWQNGIELLVVADDSTTESNDNNNDNDASSLARSLLILNATVAFGQVFIFLTIHWFSPVTTTIITTTRKFFTILLSVILYHHAFSKLQWVSVILVFSGLYVAILSTIQKGGTGRNIEQEQGQGKAKID